tara:strand:- start:373 stop:822 length:450 start_codon:yes stop_codon:yes gene_type:complete
MFFKILILISLNLLISLLLVSCSPINETTGHLPQNLNLNFSKNKQTSKEEILKTFGEPAVRNYDNTEWIYYKEKVEKLAFLTPNVKERDIFVMEFNKKNYLTNISKYNLKDQNNIKVDKFFVETKGKKNNLFEQMLGNLGNFSAEEFFE